MLKKVNKMTPEQLVWWLHGFFEIAKPTTLNEEQVQEIKNHLDLMFNKVTPVKPLSIKIDTTRLEEKVKETVEKARKAWDDKLCKSKQPIDSTDEGKTICIC